MPYVHNVVSGLGYKEEIIRNRVGNPIAIRRTEDNGNIFIKDWQSRLILAQYDAKNDQTIEYPSRKVVARGNIVDRYIPNK